MNCENLQLNLPLYIDDVLSNDERASIEFHLPSCPLCRQKLSEYKELKNDLRMVARPVIPATLLKSVRSAVANQLDQPTIYTGTEIEPTFTEKLAHWFVPYSVGTVVASVFTFVLLSVLLTTKDVTNDIIAQNQTPKDSSILLANSTPDKALKKLSLPPEYEQISVDGHIPRVNPAGALVALTKSIVRGKMSEEEVVIVANVFSNGAAQINEIVEPPSDDRALLELQKAFKTNPERSPFLPVKLEQNSQSMPVIIKLQQVNVVYVNPKTNNKQRK